MSDIIEEPFFKGSTGRNTRGVLRLTILCLIAAAAIASRLFSVIRECASSPYRILDSSFTQKLDTCPEDPQRMQNTS
jgi:hypothetical protein